MKLIVVRHGESTMNVSDLVQGNLNISGLTETGKRQAMELGQRLASKPITVAYVSPLRRAQQTAEIVLSHHPKTKIVLADQLIERSFGKYQGRSKSIFYADFNASGLLYPRFKPENGENWYEAGERVSSFIQSEIIAKHRTTNDAILIVGHGSVLTHFLMLMDNQPVELADQKAQYDKYRPANAALSVVEIEADGQHRVTLLNDISHLSELPAKV